MYEVDYLWVGEKTNTGDAIALRFTEPGTKIRRVAIIDGGFRETGERLADHVETYYGTSTVDLVVCTHPDNDHIMGLFEVIERLTVRRLLIHRPGLFGYGANDGVKADLVEDLVQLAESYDVVIDDFSYAGTQYFGGALTIAGPSLEFYKQMLADQLVLETSALAKFGHKASVVTAAAVRQVRSLFGDPGETMTGDNGGTTPRNNSSIILDLQVEDGRVMFTGDAGAPALEHAADQLDSLARSSAKIDIFDVPHHGSRHNLTPSLLDRLLGPNNQSNQGYAIASVGAEAYDHPRPEVANAIKRRGYPVYCTRGTNLWWRSIDAPARSTYNGTASPLDWLKESDGASGAA
jgi:beta-lactamase superfamily II metal-dependent hydrolase